MQFKNIIGQAEIKRRLKEMVTHNRLSHALLFLGPEGSGSLPLALALSQYIVCEKVNIRHGSPIGPSLFAETNPVDHVESAPVFPDDACGVCPSCVRAQQLIHPDIHFSYPVIPKKAGDKPISTDYISEWRSFISQFPYGNSYEWLQFIGAENKQGNITTYECNDIIHKLSLKSFESGFKILIMWMPEYLGNEGNKLLKLIEEPPPDTLFILVAENESAILPTIVSRMQLLKIPSLGTREVENALTKQADLSADQAKRIAAISQGNYREALQLSQHAEEDWQEFLRNWLNAILKTGPLAQVKWVEEISRIGRERQKQFLHYFNHLLAQAIRSGIVDGLQPEIPENEKDFVVRLNKIADISQQQAIIEELDHAVYFIERNANGKMLFHALTIKLYHIIADRKVSVVN